MILQLISVQLCRDCTEQADSMTGTFQLERMGEQSSEHSWDDIENKWGWQCGDAVVCDMSLCQYI